MTYDYGLSKQRGHAKPEKLLQQKIINLLKLKDWLVRPMHASAIMVGWPDLYMCHGQYGQRWLEVKMPKGRLEDSQVQFFTELSGKNVGVWIFQAATEEEYKKLFKPANWTMYLDMMRRDYMHT